MTEFSQKWQRWIVSIMEDLILLVSVYVAQFIVWRILRRLEKGRAARLKRIRFVQDQSMKSMSD